MRRVAPVILALVLAGCGADGLPRPPDPAPSGVELSGRVTAGVSGEL